MLCLVVENSGHRADCARSRRPLLLIMHEWAYVPHNGGRFGQNIEKGKCRHALFWPNMFLKWSPLRSRCAVRPIYAAAAKSVRVFVCAAFSVQPRAEIVELESFRTGIHKSHSRPARPVGQRDARRNCLFAYPAARGAPLYIQITWSISN